MSDDDRPRKHTSVRDVFGGSDSELSSDEEIAAPRRGSPGADDGGSGDDYVHTKPSRKPKEKGEKKKRVSKKARRDAAGEEGMDVDGAGDQPTRKRKRKSVAPKPVKEVIDFDSLPPEEARKLKLDMEIERALKGSKRAVRPKKRKDDEDTILDAAADAEVERMKQMMEAALREDVDANRDKLPATGKLRLLPQVMDVLQKQSLAQSIIDNNLLKVVRGWLEPLPDKSLPALNIQNAFFEILGKMDIDTNTLKESGLGRIVLFYTRCTRVTTKIQRQADALVAAWSRPIIKRSSSYRDRHIPTIDLDADAARGAGEKLNAILARGRAADKGKRKNMASIPQTSLATYTVAPKSNATSMRVNDSVDMDIERRKRNAERLRTLTRRVQQHQKNR